MLVRALLCAASGAAVAAVSIPAAASSPDPAPPACGRLQSLDVFRGLTVAGMLLVNNPGDMQHVFAPLRHSVWNGWTPADLVFPCFLIVIGITTQLSLTRRRDRGESDATLRRAIVRRAGMIFGLGVLLNAFPFFENRAVAGPAWLWAPLGHMAARLAHLRLLGVLQRIAIAYLIASLIARKSSTRTVALWAAALLVGYWGVMTLVPVPGEGALGARLLDDPGRTLSAWFDRTTLDWSRWGLGWHLWDASVPYDPEGLLSTVPAIGTVLFGVLVGRWLQSPRTLTDRLSALSAVGALAMVGGAIWSWTFPINKPIWTSSYALFTAGLACLALSSVSWLAEVRRCTRWLTPFLVFGTNPILAYVGSELLASVLRSSIKWKIDGKRLGTDMAVVRGLEALGLEAHLASLCWALLYVGLWYGLLYRLHRRGIFLRV